MKRQYVRLFSFLIGITFIISGVVFTLVNNYKQDRNKKIDEEKLIADEIGNVYQTFYDKEKALSVYRDEVINNFKDFSIFFTTMPEKYDGMAAKIEKYEISITEIEDISSYLKDKCTIRYSVLEANDKCEAYYINLEKSINIFVADMELFNSKINDYNTWTDGENNSVIATKKYDKLNNFVAKKYTEYVDLNDDGTYLGRNNE